MCVCERKQDIMRVSCNLLQFYLPVGRRVARAHRMYVYMRVFVCVCVCVRERIGARERYTARFMYGVATCSRLLKITGLFCKRAL